MRYSPKKRSVPVMVLLITLALPSTSHAFWELIAGDLVSYFVGKGLINEAHEAVNETINDVDRRIKSRIDQAGDRMDSTVRQAGEELSKRLQEARGILNEMIDKAAKVTANERKEFFRQLTEERRELFIRLDILQAQFEGTGNAWIDQFNRISNQLLRSLAKDITDNLSRFLLIGSES